MKKKLDCMTKCLTPSKSVAAKLEGKDKKMKKFVKTK